eukprot:CAMPEP_0116882068 /NCGR_PEP_ID=MMETSP0463-20121206/14212_1 /TAXON_ID=181622 /ORGANISM="Strombidinopsis sp, Strain SopsisLIS2011" /LENGTH=134 /DNA_ID=CAMNT_0004534707 /DNA_START=545 /DNA_END=949 /DNA_ORIENTATION=+
MSNQLDNLMAVYFENFSNFETKSGKTFSYYNTHQILFGSGVMPISDVVQHSQATEVLYPLTYYSSKYHEKFTSVVLTDEYNQFLDKYDKVVVITFGTSFIPTTEELLKLIDVVQDPSFKNVGIILALRKFKHQV